MIKPITLGTHTFPVNIIQGPLAGISCAPFRLLTWRYAKPAFTCTEMISCKTIIHKPRLANARYLNKDPEEGRVCFQLSGSDPSELGEAVKRVTDYGADLIDLNCGCPVKKIRGKGAGSALLTNVQKLESLIRAMKQNTHVPISVKIRVENQDEKFNAEVAKVITEAGADFLIVHGRHWTEHYETPCRHEEIKFFVDVMNIPVIGNGDIADLASLNRMLATGCDGVMIARAGVGQPWLIAKLMAEFKGEIFVGPSMEEIGLIFIEHVERLAYLLGSEKLAILQARKFAKYYGRELVDRNGFCTRINECESLKELREITLNWF